MTTPESHRKPTVRPPGEHEDKGEHEEAVEQAAEERMRQEKPEEVIERDKGDALMEPGQVS